MRFSDRRSNLQDPIIVLDFFFSPVLFSEEKSPRDKAQKQGPTNSQTHTPTGNKRDRAVLSRKATGIGWIHRHMTCSHMAHARRLNLVLSPIPSSSYLHN